MDESLYYYISKEWKMMKWNLTLSQERSKIRTKQNENSSEIKSNSRRSQHAVQVSCWKLKSSLTS